MWTSVFETNVGSIIVSVILGLGLAAVFRRACNEKGCVVIRAPLLAEVRDQVYRVDDACYQYSPYAAPCT
jgi:hypothetical protein